MYLFFNLKDEIALDPLQSQSLNLEYFLFVLCVCLLRRENEQVKLVGNMEQNFCCVCQKLRVFYFGIS